MVATTAPPGQADETAALISLGNPNADIHFFDTGHFALETHAHEIAGMTQAFLKRTLK